MVKMYGPSFDGSGTLVNRDVPESDVSAYQRAGYLIGSLDSLAPAPEIVPEKSVTSMELPEEDPDVLPDHFPGLAALQAAGITTRTDVLAVEDLTSIGGIGKVTAEKIVAALEGQ